MNERYHKQRYTTTMNFLALHLESGSEILDLGGESTLSNLMSKRYSVTNSGNDYDLDLMPNKLEGSKMFDAVTAFEILEHLVNPFGVLSNIEAPCLFTSTPIPLWFEKTYRDKNDPFDQHFHEFEPWQFDMLLDKSGWQKVEGFKVTYPWPIKVGFRPFLRLFYHKYYFTYSIRKK